MSFLNTILSFSPFSDYKIYDEYFSEKIRKVSTIRKIHLKCDCIDGSVLNGVRQPIPYSVVSDKFPGYKVISEPEIKHSKGNKQICFEYYNFLLRRRWLKTS